MSGSDSQQRRTSLVVGLVKYQSLLGSLGADATEEENIDRNDDSDQRDNDDNNETTDDDIVVTDSSGYKMKGPDPRDDEPSVDYEPSVASN